MAELIEVANAMFKDKYKWEKITDDDKSKFFFIFNRYFSKRYTTFSNFLNIKTVDKVAGMNLWFYLFKDKTYPQWFWSKSPKVETENFDTKDFQLLLDKLQINKKEDLNYLIERYPDLIEDELKFYKNKK